MHNDSAHPNDPRGRADAATALGSTALGQLRAYMDELVRVIAEHPDASLERDEAQWRLEELTEELTASAPSAPRVKSRWIRLAPLLSKLRPDIPIPAVNELINNAL